MSDRDKTSQGHFEFSRNGIGSKKPILIDYNDYELFGGDDAAYVDFTLLKSYSIKRDDCTAYLDEKSPFKILCAPKGTGKTTISRLWENEISLRPGFFSIYTYDSDISPDLGESSLTSWIRAWKKAIIQAILSKLLIENNLEPFILDDIGFLHESNRNRTNQRSTLSSLLNQRLKSSENHAAISDVLKSNDNKQFWVFLDEIDQYFTKDEQSIRKVASLLIAARELVSVVSNLHVRTTLKPTVWSIIRTNIASMSTIEELVVYLTWKVDGIRSILAKRIESYLIRKNIISGIGELFNEINLQEREDGLVNKIFSNDNFDLGKGNRKPHVILSSLGFYRPRWVLDLCKTVTQKKGKKGQIIEFDDVKKCLPEYGQERIKDLSTEYNYQCSQINEIVYSFLNTKSSYKLYELFSHINDKVLSKKNISISGVSDDCDAQQISNFLYEIGFIEPKKILSPGKYEFLHFSDYPSLIENELINESVEEDLFWEIHPAFRNVLHLGELTNKQILEKNKKIWGKKNT